MSFNITTTTILEFEYRKKNSEVFFPLASKVWQRLFVIGVTLDFFCIKIGFKLLHKFLLHKIVKCYSQTVG